MSAVQHNHSSPCVNLPDFFLDPGPKLLCEDAAGCWPVWIFICQFVLSQLHVLRFNQLRSYLSH